MNNVLIIIGMLISAHLLGSEVFLGVDVFFQKQHDEQLKGKNVGLITNHTGVNKECRLTSDLFKNRPFQLKALFCPEHGLKGVGYAFEKIEDSKEASGIPVYSLHGKTRRPTDEMLKDIHVLIYDIQDIGVRAYTYATTLFYVMEEAAKKNIKVMVLDRPNPMGGLVVDGPMLEEEFRSFIGYANVPYCHGMTIGELAHFFNEEYKLQCQLEVVPMKGWKREMKFKDTSLSWIPPSPHIPEADTPFFSASTGMLGEIELVNIGIGYTLPFKVVGATWIDADLLAENLNKLKLPGVLFTPFHYRPFYGSYRGSDCHGVLIMMTDPKEYKPTSVQFAILGMLKSLYPQEVEKKLAKMDVSKRRLFNLASGNDRVLSLLEKEKYVTWKLLELDKEKREHFLKIRQKYLRKEYD